MKKKRSESSPNASAKEKTKKKKKNVRNQTTYPGLKKQYNLKIRQELFDQDYIDKLNDKEKAFLNKFNEEFINANFNHPAPLHKGKKRQRECYGRNNARNRDTMSITSTTKMLKDDSYYIYLDDLNSGNVRSSNPSEVEDVIIDAIDSLKLVKK
jgi:hypothetical protein